MHRVGDLNLSALDEDAASIGAVGAEQDVHQGRLAGPVLPQEADDLAPAHGEIDVRIGADAAEAL